MTVKRHPIMGFFTGLFLGLGLFLMLTAMGVVPLTVVWLAVLVRRRDRAGHRPRLRRPVPVPQAPTSRP